MYRNALIIVGHCFKRLYFEVRISDCQNRFYEGVDFRHRCSKLIWENNFIFKRLLEEKTTNYYINTFFIPVILFIKNVFSIDSLLFLSPSKTILFGGPGCGIQKVPLIKR